MDTRISLRKLEVFEAVVELGGVSRAADHLLVAQPVVTAHIRSLEQRLGVKLFYREGRQLRLTEGGREVLRWATDVLRRTRELARLVDGHADGTSGSVAMASSMSIGSYVLPGVLMAFRATRPNAHILLSILDSEHAIRDTEAGDTDFAIVVTDREPKSFGLVGRQIGAEDVLLVASPEAEPLGDSIPIARLAELPFIDAPHGIIRRDLVEGQLARAGIRNRNVILEIGHAEGIKRAIVAGSGVSLLFRSAVRDELRRGELREITIEGMCLTVPIYLVHRSDKQFSALHAALIDEIEQHFGRIGPHGHPGDRAAPDAPALT